VTIANGGSFGGHVTVDPAGSFSHFDTFTKDDSFVCCVTIAFFDSFVLFGAFEKLGSFR
jgi:hypothetical protein